jgi:hypothetical protein
MFKGKALLIIDRLHTDNPKEFHWDIDVRQFTINQDDPGGEVAEAFNCVQYDVIQAPAAAYKMQVGDRIRVLVHYEMHFSQDYWGESDMDLYYERERVLRRQPFKEKKYRRNSYEFWKADQLAAN